MTFINLKHTNNPRSSYADLQINLYPILYPVVVIQCNVGLSIYPQIKGVQIRYRNLAFKSNKYHCVNKEKKNIFWST